MTDTQHTPDPAAQEKAEEFDFDAWLAGAKRSARYVTLYGRGDLLADLARINTAIERAGNLPKERALNDTSADALRAEADRIRAELDKSKIEVRVEASIEDEIDRVRDEARANTTEARKAAEDKARAVALEASKALGMDMDEEKAAITTAVAQVSDEVVGNEVALILLADRVQVRRNGRWEPIGRAALDQMRARLGDPQILRLKEAWTAASQERPEELTVPSSPER